MDFKTQLKTDQARIEARLSNCFDEVEPLEMAMQYAVLGGGKRLRAFLVYESARIFELAKEAADYGAAAIELLHAYSLVHDDLPAMDDDDLRRGQPTVHVKWNEWTAILVGDALQSLAFEELVKTPIDADRKAALIASFAQAAGAKGMVRGQFYDLQSESQRSAATLDEIRAMQSDKTGALIAWAACFGARAANADAAPFQKYADYLGLAFQIWDDVLDVEGESETLGKTVGKDDAANKATFVAYLGLDGAKKAAKDHIAEAKSALGDVKGATGLLALADFVINRHK